MKKLRVTILLSILLGLIAFTGYFQYPEEVEKNYRIVKNKISALKLSLFPYRDEYFTYITIEKQRVILDWLDTGKFDELDNYFRKLTVQFKNDIKYEQSLIQSYASFEFHADVKLEMIDEWVDRDGSKAFALTARAFYFVAMAWKERGNDYISKTSQKQIEGMNSYMDKASIDIHKSLAIDNKVISPYILLVEISAVSGSDNNREKYFERGIRISPGSYVIRSLYQDYLEPKWGGSEAEKKRFVKTQLEYLKYNPGLIRLQARYYYNKATTYNSSQIQTRTGLLEKSLEYDRYWKSLDLLGKLYNKQQKYQQAIDVLTESLSRKPTSYWPLVRRGNAYSKIKDFKSAEIDYKEGIRIYPKRDYAYYYYIVDLRDTKKYSEALALTKEAIIQLPNENRKWYTLRAGMYLSMLLYKEALEDYTKIVNIDENDSWAWTNIGILSQYHIKNPELSINAHRRALEIKGEHYNYYNYASALYETKSPEAPQAFREYLAQCKKSACDQTRMKWSKRILACVDKKSTCDLDKHDYQAWL